MSVEHLALTNSWLSCPKSFFYRVTPTPVASPFYIHCDDKLAQQLGIDFSGDNRETLLNCFSGNQLLAEMAPVSTVYAGHQFGIFTSTLGDGRAILLGEVQTDSGQKLDLQLKGSGLTPYSRTMDGRFALSDAIREYLASKALIGLGINTAQSLCLIGSETPIGNENGDTAAILARTASSFIRFGHFEYFYHRDDLPGLRSLFDHVVEQHFPQLLNEATEKRPLLLLETVIARTAKLIANWQSVGFTHGVMNTDNMLLSGETVDLGPFGFMETFDFEFSPNPSDDQKRYKFSQQHDIGRWNCLALAQSLLPLLETAIIPARLLRLYRQTYQEQYMANMRAKLGLLEEHIADSDLINHLLALMSTNQIDYSRFFRGLAHHQLDSNNPCLLQEVTNKPSLVRWLDLYRQRLELETTTPYERRKQMNSVNPSYLLREHLIEHVVKYAQKGDFSKLIKVSSLLEDPYEDHFGFDFYSAPQLSNIAATR